jgi:hypothetical protein
MVVVADAKIRCSRYFGQVPIEIQGRWDGGEPIGLKNSVHKVFTPNATVWCPGNCLFQKRWLR